MGKSLIIKGADFSENAIRYENWLDFNSLPYQPHNIALNDTVLKLVTPSSASFFEINLSDYPNAKSLFINTGEHASRVLFTNAQLPTAQTSGTGISINSYLASSLDDSYFNSIAIGTETTIDIPSGSAYLYIRRAGSGGTLIIPESAAIIN